jgi:hypothetical protein
MADAPDWLKPHRPPTPTRQPQCGEKLFEFYVERDHARWLCELRDHGEVYGVEAQFYRNRLRSSRAVEASAAVEHLAQVPA